MNITLNGQPKELPNALNLKQTVEQFREGKTPVAAELNGNIIKNLQWEKVILKEGDNLELVSFMGGGANFCKDNVETKHCLVSAMLTS